MAALMTSNQISKRYKTLKVSFLLKNSYRSINRYRPKTIIIPGYDDLMIEDKVKYDIYLTYTVNSLYFLYLKLQGNQKNVSQVPIGRRLCLNTHFCPQDDIKHELGRIKTAMKRNSDIHDSRTKRPRLDQGAAKRFVKSGLWDKDDPNRAANKHKRFKD
jgi:hypothetical protein